MTRTIKEQLDPIFRPRSVAIVGASNNPGRWGYQTLNSILNSSQFRGEVYPINPRDEVVQGLKAYKSVTDVPGPIDLVDIFRNSEAAGPITDEAIALAGDKKIKVVWMQLGVRNDAAAARAEAAGLTVIMDHCPKIEWGRLHGELSWGGINSRIISSKRRRLRVA